MTTNIFNAKMFIIPNDSYKIIGELSDWNKRIINNNNKKYREMNMKFNDEVIELKEGDTIIEVWTHDENSDNWQDHRAPRELCPGEFKVGGFPNYIPLRLIENIKEDEEIVFTIGKNTELHIQCSQKSGRYSSFGPFEEVLNRVI